MKTLETRTWKAFLVLLPLGLGVCPLCFGLPLTEEQTTLNAGEYPSIQAAVNVLAEAGGTVFVPPGVHEISEPIVVTRSEVTITGAGSGTILKNTSSGGANTFEVRGQPRGGRIWRVTVENMHLLGNENSGHAVFAQHVNEISLNNMWIDHHGGSGLYLDDCYENPRIFDNNIAYNRKHGIFLEGCHDIVVSANQLEENGYGIYAVNVWNAGVTGNSVDDHIHNSLYFKHVIGSIVSSNMFENSLNQCLVLDEGCNGVTVSGNVMRYSGPNLLRLIGANGITVTGNTFEADEGSCIEIVKGSRSIAVSGNVLFGLRESSQPVRGMVWGIVAVDVIDIAISGNTIIRPFAGGISVRGGSNRYLAISGNTIKNPSWNSPGEYSGIFLENTCESVVSANIVVDDSAEPGMKWAIEEAGDSDHNIVTNNLISKGRSGDIQIRGSSTQETGNRSRK